MTQEELWTNAIRYDVVNNAENQRPLTEEETELILNILEKELSGGFKEIVHKDMPYKIITNYLDPKSYGYVFDELFKIAAVVKKNIVLLNWMSQNFKNRVSPFMDENHFILATSNRKTSRDKGYRPSRNTIIFPYNTERSGRVNPDIRLSGLTDYTVQIRSLEHLFGSIKHSPIMMEDGWEIGRATKEGMILYIDIKELCSKSKFPGLIELFRRFLLYFPKLRDQKTEKIERLFKNFQTIKEYYGDFSDNSLNSRIADLRSKISQHRRVMIDSNLELTVLTQQKEKNKLKNPKLDLGDDFVRNIIEGFVNQKYFDNFNYDGNKIILLTPKVYIQSPLTKKKYYMGFYRIEIKGDGDISIYNQEASKIISSSDHPHVRDNIPCLGTIKEILPELIIKGDLLSAFHLIGEFIYSYNPNGAPYMPLEIGWGDPGDYDYEARTVIVPEEQPETPEEEEDDENVL